ncbi:EboA domain-containing protein [Nonomuraea sp. B12E4]|uniref:EboA domain-containing protein n=1 Tax=Nonomuraea sp. B12E4 TaxID=3153564 RepID=UPI00325E7061
MTTLDGLRSALVHHGALTTGGWLAGAVARVVIEPDGLERLFAAAGRQCGRALLRAEPGWSADQAARALLLAALPPARMPAAVDTAYQHGDAGEKLAVLKALPLLPIGDAGLPLLRDALRTNDPRLVAAALSPYATRLDDAAWRQGVLKCVFMGVPLEQVHGLDERADAELAAMLDGFVRERRAAGRTVPGDALTLLRRVVSLEQADATAGSQRAARPEKGDVTAVLDRVAPLEQDKEA